MREIKFRGKSTTEFDDKKIWIYGDLLQPTELCNIYEISDCTSIDGSRYEVNKETVGQYTGLKDKNGKEIYEGDIVKIRTNIGIELIANIFYRDCAFRTNCAREFVGEETLYYWYANDSDIEVIRKYL